MYYITACRVTGLTEEAIEHLQYGFTPNEMEILNIMLENLYFSHIVWLLNEMIGLRVEKGVSWSNGRLLSNKKPENGKYTLSGFEYLHFLEFQASLDLNALFREIAGILPEGVKPVR